MKLNIYSFFIFLFYAAMASATPPSEILLSYDTDKSILHVSARHPSERLQRHYLRRLVISKNDVVVQTVTFSSQKLASGLEEDIEFKADPGDKISVEVFCSQGGSKKAELLIPKPDGEKDQHAAQ